MSEYTEVVPDQDLVKAVREGLIGVGRDELVDLIRTSALASAVSATDAGRKIQASYLVGAIITVAEEVGEEEAADILDDANAMAATVVEVMEHYQAKHCKECPEHGMCADEEFEEPPTVH
jgi:hypothetical protein